MERIVLAGGSGLIGRALARRWVADGADVVVLTRSPRPRAVAPREAGWNGRDAGEWQREIDGAAAVVNLAGANLAQGRWTAARKQVLRSSRLEPTAALVEAITRVEHRPKVYLQASGADVYGARGDEDLAEDAAPGSGFLAELCRDWEAASRGLDPLGVRRVLLRTAVVLTREGGALPRMALPFRFGVGGRLGDGEQWMSWILLDDAVRGYRFAADRDELSGAVNLAAPEPVRNRELTRALARALHRPAPFVVPAFALRLAFGEMSQVLLAGQRAVPARLTAAGFEFVHPRIGEALADLYRR